MFSGLAISSSSLSQSRFPLAKNQKINVITSYISRHHATTTFSSNTCSIINYYSTMKWGHFSSTCPQWRPPSQSFHGSSNDILVTSFLCPPEEGKRDCPLQPPSIVITNPLGTRCYVALGSHIFFHSIYKKEIKQGDSAWLYTGKLFPCRRTWGSASGNERGRLLCTCHVLHIVLTTL